MSDTIQGVTWALGQTCPLRFSGDWEKPTVALSSLGVLQSVALARNSPRSGFGIFDGVYVTSYCSNARFPYPQSGYVIEKLFAPYEGFDAVCRLCASCPANSGPAGIAGCTGWFHRSFYAEDEKQLARVIQTLQLEDRVSRCFPKTASFWLSFWISSPLSRESAEVLYEILSAVHQEDSLKWHEPEKLSEYSEYKGLGRFLAALKRSIDENLPMHVWFAPPGHVDLGWDTTFPHCPRCKALAPVKLWSRKYPVEPIACKVCGNLYSPAATESSKESEREQNDLRENLGEEAFAKFATVYLMAQGASETEALEIVRETEAKHKRQAELFAEKQEFFRRQKVYLEEEVFQGLPNRATEEEKG